MSTLRTVIITGATAGIGRAAAKRLSAEKCKVTLEQIKQEVQVNDQSITHIVVDIENRQSIDQFIMMFSKLKRKCDVLINNAGAMFLNQEIVNGIDRTFWLNHFGTMYLTLKMLPYMNSPSRVVIVSSGLHSKGIADPTVLTNPLPIAHYDGMVIYSTSKLFNLWFARHLCKVYLPASPYPTIEVVAMNPGFVPTTNLKRTIGITKRVFMDYIISWMPFATPVEESAERLWFCSNQDAIDGSYIDKQRCIAIEGSLESNDMNKAKELWDLSCDVLCMPEAKV